MRLWPRKRDSQAPKGQESPGPNLQYWRNPLDAAPRILGFGLPESLAPKLNPKTARVFDDEIDPAWRDDATAE